MSLEGLILATRVLKESSDSARQIWYPGSGVVLDCIDSWSLQPYLLSFTVWLSWGRRKSVCSLCLPSTGDFDNLGAQYLSVNKDSHQLPQCGFVFYRGWSVRILLFFVLIISSPDTLHVLWYLPVTHLAALLWTISNWYTSMCFVLSPSLEF